MHSITSAWLEKKKERKTCDKIVNLDLYSGRRVCRTWLCVRYRNEILHGSTVIIEKPRGSPGIIRHCGRPVRTMSLQGVAETEWGGRRGNNLKLFGHAASGVESILHCGFSLCLFTVKEKRSHDCYENHGPSATQSSGYFS